MNQVERHYRLVTIQERFQQLEAELNVLAETTAGVERYRIERMAWNALQAASLMRVPENSKELTALLKHSLAAVRDAKRCEQVSKHVIEVSEETEKAQTANLSSFPKPITVEHP